MTTYTKINKASGTSYSKISAGNYLYDDSSVIYDDPNVSYDGVKSTYINIAKAVDGEFNLVSGMATGLLIPFTYSADKEVGGYWTKISKAT